MPRIASLKPAKLPSREDGQQWCLNVPAVLSPTGKRQRLFFATEREANLECELLKTRRVNFGHSLSSLSPERIAEAAACYDRLELGCPGVSLSHAVSEFLALHHLRTASVPMAALWKRFLKSKSSASPSYQQELDSTFRRLSPLDNVLASDVTPKQIEESLSGFPAAYRNAALRYLRAAFNFGIRSGYLRENPIKRLEFTKIVRDSVEVIPPATVKKLLEHALANDIELVPFLVLSFYAGIRPDGELQKLLWSDIDLNAKEHHVTIRATVAKKRKKRWVDLSDNAVAWLERYRFKGGGMEGKIVPFSASTLRRKRRKNAEAADLESWPQQSARHTFCSCWLRQYGNINRLVIMAGHESPQVLWNHYYQAVTPEAATEFWAIYPPALKPEDAKIVAFA